MLVAGFIFAMIEHKDNDDIESHWTSVFRGVYWSAATLTTVGYGDVTAKTALGRAYSTFVMWAGLTITGMLTAVVVSAVNLETAAYESFNIHTSDIAVVEGSAGAHYVMDIAPSRNVHVYSNISEAVDALTSEKVDAIVHDMPILNYVLADVEGVAVSGENLTDENYAFAVKRNEWQIDEFDVLMLEFIESKTWNTVVQSYQ
jgi:ABC-type amino acid transport substrate-binding protein